MNEAQLIPAFWRTSRKLPDYTAILAVDAKGFTELPAVRHAPVSEMISATVDQALATAGLGDLRDNRFFSANTGDGVVLGFAPARLPYILWPFLDILDGMLAERNGSVGAPILRLRASVNVGPLPVSGAAGDGNGTPRNDTHRLLDSRELKELLVSSDEETTHLVAIISQRVYEDVVLGGYTGLPPDRCTRITDGPAQVFVVWLALPSIGRTAYRISARLGLEHQDAEAEMMAALLEAAAVEDPEQPGLGSVLLRRMCGRAWTLAGQRVRETPVGDAEAVQAAVDAPYPRAAVSGSPRSGPTASPTPARSRSRSTGICSWTTSSSPTSAGAMPTSKSPWRSRQVTRSRSLSCFTSSAR